MRTRLIVSILLFCAPILPAAAFAQWQLDGVPVCAAGNSQLKPIPVSDAAGGVIIVWQDDRTISDIYAQRLNASGQIQWTNDGAPICTSALAQTDPAITPDGSGGAVACWIDARNGNTDVFAQRVNASGVTQWTANGVALCTQTANQSGAKIVADGTGGAIVAWIDQRNGNSDIFAQRVNASGVTQWTANGVAICTHIAGQSGIVIIPDGAGGAIVVWNDPRSSNSDVFAQRVNAAGVTQWTLNGVALSNVGGEQVVFGVIPDGASGAIATWYDSRGTSFDIYAQRVNASGATQWTTNGVVLCNAVDDQYEPVIVPDASGGAIVAWYDNRSALDFDVYAQRVNASGVIQWTANGVAICIQPNAQYLVNLVSDGAGGVLVAWQDERTGVAADVYAQRVNAFGVIQWTADGMPLSTNPSNQVVPAAVADGSGGAMVAWQDERTGQVDVYAQRVEGRYGYWGRPEPVLVTAKDNPSDQGGKVALNWNASGRDVLNQQLITDYTIWRALDVAAMEALVSSGVLAVVNNPRDAADKRGIVWREQTATATYYWELAGSQPAYYDDAYSFLAPTRQDSVAGNPATHYFRVVAEANDNQFYNWPSNVLSARSVDNLSPAAPLLLTAQRVGADVQLNWSRVHVADLRDYAVYRATSSGVTPVPINFLASSDDSVLVDAGAPTSTLYYIVTAYDVHANQSVPSNEASVGATTDVGNLPPISRLTVRPHHPNPFASNATLDVGLPVDARIQIDVFDIAGRRVASRAMGRFGKGWQRIDLAATDDAGRPLPSGVYFYRVTAAGETATRKMVIAR
jgi:hypothetical protein